MSSEITISTRGSSTASTSLQGSEATPTTRPMVIGIYGISGCGKSYLLDQLSRHLSAESRSSRDPSYLFFDSSQVIASQVPGGLRAFQALDAQEQERVRETAIKYIQNMCSKANKVAIIAGHYAFWRFGSEPERVMTEADRSTYTYIIYLNTPPTSIYRYCQEDADRKRISASEEHLRKWMELEKSELRDICYRSGILFSVLSPDAAGSFREAVVQRIGDLGLSSERTNDEAMMLRLGNIVQDMGQTNLEKAVVLDADKTLAPGDSGTLFWRFAAESIPGADKDTLKALFSSELGYSYLAFQQAALMYGDVADEGTFNNICDRVASDIYLYPEFMAFLQEAAKHDHVAVIVVTCGLEAIWTAVLKRAGLYPRVKLLAASGSIYSGIITPKVKKDIVVWLQQTGGLTTWAFGDSPIDIPMLRAADYPIVIVGEDEARSKSMDGALSVALNGGLEARQALLPDTASPRLDKARLPVVQIADPNFRGSVFRRRGNLSLLHATDKAASKLIMTPTRDARNFGPHLREAHHRMGLYLATEFVMECIGIEEFLIPHVNGAWTEGFRLKNEANTLIVALMRAGEPMASGVSAAFPTAMFLHAKEPDDLTASRIKEASTILLVDGVVNEGSTAVKFTRHIRRVNPDSRVVIVAGVVQGRCVGRDGGNQFARLMREDEKLTLVALRISENKYTGKGTVDTGNRLFNTTHLT